MLTSDFDYELPPELIAQEPARPRDSSRLLRLDRATRRLSHHVFRDLVDLLKPEDGLVLNETRVLPARIKARKLPTGGKVELLLLKRLAPRTWEVMVGGKRLPKGQRLALPEGLTAEIIENLDGPRRVVVFSQPISTALERIGEMPLPPYIHTPLADPLDYQTVFSRVPGSAAAPTAGLHFTEALLGRIEDRGVAVIRILLHVGMDTFLPVEEADPRDHRIHTEWCEVSPEAAESIASIRLRGGRIIAVGTTATRALETAARAAPYGDIVAPFIGATDVYILPGCQFRLVDALITNFHLPRSTLLMMVSAFAGREQVLAAYEVAKEAGYRFYSFGDAMLIT